MKQILTVLVLMICSVCHAARINVVTQGVIPDDGLYDSHAIQQIVDAAAPGSTIFFPSGEYLIDTPVVCFTNTLRFVGEAGTKWKYRNSGYDWYNYYGSRVGMLNIGADNIWVDSFYFDQNFRNSGKSDGSLASIGCLLIGCAYLDTLIVVYNFKVTNSVCYDYYGDAISVFQAQCINFLAENDSTISTYVVQHWDTAGPRGEQGINVTTGDNVVIRNNVILGALDDAIAVHRYCNNVVITDNYVTTTGGRILICGTTNGIVSRNTIIYIQDGGYSLQMSFDDDAPTASLNSNVDVSNNTIQIQNLVNIVFGMRLFGPGVRINVLNNLFERSQLYDDTAIYVQRRKLIADNTFYFVSDVSIKYNFATNFKYMVIEENNTDVTSEVDTLGNISYWTP